MDPQIPVKQPQPGVAPVVPNGTGAIYQTGKGGPVVNDQSVPAMTPVKPSATTPQPLKVPQVGTFPPDPSKMANLDNRYLQIAKEWRKKTAEQSGTPEKSAFDIGSMTNPLKEPEPFKPSTTDLNDEQHWGEVNAWQNSRPNTDSGFTRKRGPSNPNDMYESYTKNFRSGSKGLQKPLERKDYFARQRYEFGRAPNGVRTMEWRPEDAPGYWNSRNKETYRQRPGNDWMDKIRNNPATPTQMPGTLVPTRP